MAIKLNSKTMKLTKSEKLVIARRRTGKIQAVVAKELGVSRQWYNYLERNAGKVEWGAELKVPPIGNITLNEACTVWRKRLGIKQDEVAKLAGIDRLVLYKIERGAADAQALADYYLNNYSREELNFAG